jgi:hypothetical protein
MTPRLPPDWLFGALALASAAVGILVVVHVLASR